MQKGFADIQDEPSGGGGVQDIVADHPGSPELLEQPSPPRFSLKNLKVKQPLLPTTVPGLFELL